MHIAIVGGDAKFSLLLKQYLDRQGYSAVLLPDPAKAFSKLASEPAQLLVVAALAKELAVPLARSLRSDGATRAMPVIHVDPKATHKDVVHLLDSGYDDCLARPFNEMVFLARVRTLLRRSSWSGAQPPAADPVARLSAGELTLLLIERVARLGTKEVALTRLEFDLLAHLMRNKEKALKREEILEAVWKYPEDVETRTLDKHVETLRRKLGAAGKAIQTLHGVGYRFQEPAKPLRN